MSLDLSGSNAAVKANAVSIHVTMNHPLIKLANAAYQIFSGKGIVAG